jgi:hypothetical protein
LLQSVLSLKKAHYEKINFGSDEVGSVSYFSYAGKIFFSPAGYTVLRDDSRHISASQVPVAVRNNFRAMFPNARNVEWSVEREDGRREFEAEFTRNGRRFKAYFLMALLLK